MFIFNASPIAFPPSSIMALSSKMKYKDRINKDLEFDTKITITANDPRWVRKPDGVGVTEFPTMSTSKLAETKQLTAGLAFETEVEYSLFETEDLEFSYINTVQPGSIPIWRNGQAIQAGEYVRYNGQVYISKTDTDGNGVNEANVLEFEPVDEPILLWISLDFGRSFARLS